MTQRSLLPVLLCVVGCGCGPTGEAEKAETAAERAEPAPPSSRAASRTTVHTPASLTSIASGRRDARGRTAGIACATCHEVREEPHRLPESADELGGPHAGLHFEHGDNECASCHHPGRYDRLRLASGKAIPLADAMRLCSQCHGPQKRDYDHGAHGGMRGYWDLESGPRERNHCTDCHDPHAPAFPSYRPVFPPRDRFLEPHGGDHE